MKKEGKDVWREGNPGVCLEGWRARDGVEGAFILRVLVCADENVIVSAYHKYAPQVSI